MKKRTEVSYSYTLGANHDRSFRDKVGTFIRDLADKLDGRRSVAVTMSSNPPLSDAQTREVVLFGVEQMREALRIEVSHTALESLVDGNIKINFNRRKGAP